MPVFQNEQQNQFDEHAPAMNIDLIEHVAEQPIALVYQYSQQIFLINKLNLY